MSARLIPIQSGDLELGQKAGFEAALYIYGLRNCTFKNDSESVIRIPVGRGEAYIDLDPGEQITLRTVEAS